MRCASLVTFSTRYPARAANRSAAQPASVSQRCSESEPRLRCTTRNASPSAVSRASQADSSSCKAALPIRIGGLDQISPKLAGQVRVIGRHAADVGQPGGTFVNRAQR